MNDIKISPEQKFVLIIEDDDTVADFLKYYISKQGFNVDIANDGTTALKKIKTCPPDLIVLDVMLPGISGYEIVKSLQSNLQYKKIPIIVITGKLKDKTTESMFSFEPNVKFFMHKPVQPDLLLSKIHQLLGTKPVEEKIAEEKSGFYKKFYE